jgi:excisionase family DNA binding protein
VEPILLTTGEAAALLGLSRSKLYELMAAGLVESVRIGRARRVPPEALETYVRRLRGADEGNAA